MRGPDQLALRLPRSGGTARVQPYPALDTVLWSSTDKTPPIERVLAFDDEGGAIAAVDTKGVPVRIDLRLGTTTREPKPALTHVVSRDGVAIYGLTASGSAVRFTPSGSWTFKPPAPARDLVTVPDGSILLLSDSGQTTTVWQVRPPETSITDTALVPHALRTVRTQMGDRLYLAVNDGLIALRSRGLTPTPPIKLEHPVRAAVTTPSGDRIYVAEDSTSDIAVLDRYSGQQRSRIELPGTPSELRMDPFGRFLLVRPAVGDSLWVIAISNDKLSGSVRSAWREDLPTVGPDGALVTLRDNEVVFVDASTLRSARTIKAGGKDVWFFVAWNGFRPRAKELDEPVTFQEPGSPTGDSGSTSSLSSRTPRDSAQAVDTQSSPASLSPASAEHGFTIQFAALRDPKAAQQAAQGLQAGGLAARVISTQRSGVTIYRVIMGPYPSRAEADRVAKGTGKSFWVYEGQP
jgi:cell division septation protein DedD